MFALIQGGCAVFGVGETEEGAREHAAQSLEGGAEVAGAAQVVRAGGNDYRAAMSNGALVVVRCSKALASRVEPDGVASWICRDGEIDLPEDDE